MHAFECLNQENLNPYLGKKCFIICSCDFIVHSFPYIFLCK